MLCASYALAHAADLDGGTALKTKRTYRMKKIGDRIIALSRTYMNESGRAAQDILAATGQEPKSLLVVHDDADLPLGTYRDTFGAGSAGHLGIESIVKTLGTAQFGRIRIGIREQKESAIRVPASAFVLAHIPEEEYAILEKTFQDITRACGLAPTPHTPSTGNS